MRKHRIDILHPVPIQVEVSIQTVDGTDRRDIEVRPITLADDQRILAEFGDPDEILSRADNVDLAPVFRIVLQQSRPEDVDWFHAVAGTDNLDHLVNWIMGSVSTGALISGISDVIHAARREALPETEKASLKKKAAGYLRSTSLWLTVAAHLVGIYVGLEHLPCDSLSLCMSSFGFLP